MFECDECGTEYVNVLSPGEVDKLRADLAKVTAERDKAIREFLPDFPSRDSALAYLESAGIKHKKVEQVSYHNDKVTGELKKYVAGYSFYYAGAILNKVGVLLKDLAAKDARIKECENALNKIAYGHSTYFVDKDGLRQTAKAALYGDTPPSDCVVKE